MSTLAEQEVISLAAYALLLATGIWNVAAVARGKARPGR
jgi:hypothetical protein